MCQRRVNNKGQDDQYTEYYHSVLAAVFVIPNYSYAVPLCPELISPQDSDEKQDWKRRVWKGVRYWYIVKTASNSFPHHPNIRRSSSRLNCVKCCDISKNSQKDIVFVAAKITAPIYCAFTIMKDGTAKMLQPECYHANSRGLPTDYHDAGQFCWGTPKQLWNQEQS